MGETVTVTGTLKDDGHGQRIIQMKTGEWRDRPVQPVSPQPVTIAVAKDLDGSLVRVHGTLTRALVDDAPYGDRLWIADDTGTVQIYMPRSTRIDPAQLLWLKPGQFLQVTGLSSEYNGSDEVMPRDRADLAPATAPDQYRHRGAGGFQIRCRCRDWSHDWRNCAIARKTARRV